MDRYPAILVVKHGDEFQTGAERFKIVPQRRHSHVVGVLKLGDRPLRHGVRKTWFVPSNQSFLTEFPQVLVIQVIRQRHRPRVPVVLRAG